MSGGVRLWMSEGVVQYLGLAVPDARAFRMREDMSARLKLSGPKISETPDVRGHESSAAQGPLQKLAQHRKTRVRPEKESGPQKTGKGVWPAQDRKGMISCSAVRSGLPRGPRPAHP